jgi:hypothetical protein
VGAILPPNVLPANEPDIGFIDEGCGLQWMIRPLPRHVPRSQAVQFLVNARRKPF